MCNTFPLQPEWNGVFPWKVWVCQETVEFMGFHITMEGIKPTENDVQAIRNFPTPTNIIDVRSWFGQINQVAYSFIKTDHMTPFPHWARPHHSSEMGRGRVQEKQGEVRRVDRWWGCLFWYGAHHLPQSTLKQKWVELDPTVEDMLLWDDSATCCEDEDGWKLVLTGGHFCNKADENYSLIEGEATAVAKGLQDTK
jgi:hypothetical protein